MRKETLFVSTDLSKTAWFLTDSSNFLIGRFDSKEDAQKWCDENNYKLREK